MKKLIILLFGITAMLAMKAQSPLLDSAKNELYRINKIFDSSQYLGFNMDILYRSDSAGITIGTDAVSGNYVLNKKNLYYQMGSTQYVQTDSFSYTLYTDEKLMIMTKNFVTANSDAFPLRTFIDSIMHYYANNYSINIDTTMADSAVETKKITFTANGGDTLDNGQILPYTSFSIQYRDDSYYPLKFQFSYKDHGHPDEEDTTVNPNAPVTSFPITKTVTMNFSQYKAFVDTQIFDDILYVNYNRQRKVYEPSEKFKVYRFITSGFENEDEDAQYYKEVPYSGN